MNDTEQTLPSSGEEKIQSARFAYSRALLHIVVYALFALVLRSIVYFILQKAGAAENLSPTLQYLVQFGPMYLGAFPLYLLVSKSLKADPPPKRSLSLPVMGTAFIVCEGLAITGALIGVIFTLIASALMRHDTTETFILEGVSGSGALFFTFLAAFCAPIIEEMLFRKVLIDRIRKYGDGTAILLSGIFFGLFHGNFMQCFFAAMLGMYFAYIYIRTGKVRYTIALHMIINSMSTIVAGYWLRALPEDAISMFFSSDLQTMFFGFSFSSELQNGIPAMTYLLEGLLQHRLNIAALADLSANAPARVMLMSMPSLGGFAIQSCFMYTNAIAGIVLLIRHRKTLRINPPEEALPAHGNAKAVFTAVGFWALTGYCIWLFVRNLII